MRNLSISLLALSIFFSCSTPCLQAETEAETNTAQKKAETNLVSRNVSTKFDPFTGKIIKSK